MPRSLLPRLGDFLYVGIFSGCMLVGQRMLNVDSDLGRHLTLGRYMIESKSIPIRDALSFTMAGAYRPPYEWLAQVALALADQILSLDGVVLVTAAVIAGAFLLVFLDGRQRSDAPLIALVLAVWAAATSSLHWLTRPHIFSFLLLAIWLRLLERIRLGQRQATWQLPLAMLIWANLHGAFVVGFLSWAAYFAGWAMERRLGHGSPEIGSRLMLAGATSLVASLMTPARWQNWAAVLRNASPYVLSRTAETLPVDFTAPGSWPFLGLLVLGFVLAFINRRRVAPAHGLLLLGLAVAGVGVTRNIPLLSIAAVPVFSLWARELMGDKSRITVLEARISEIESQLGRCLWSPLVVSFVAILLIHYALTTRRTFFSYDPRIFPVTAAEWASQHPINGNMLNELNWGGYLLHRMWPAQRVFIDSQTDFYGEHFIREYADLVSANPGWQQQLLQHNVSWVMIRPQAPLSGELRLDSGWQKAFEDPTAVIFMRDSP